MKKKLKCHWCEKESKNVFCSPKCLVEHEIDYADFSEKVGADRIEEIIKNTKWCLDSDGSVQTYELGEWIIKPGEAIPL